MPSPNTGSDRSSYNAVAALCSGGLDSAVMLVELAKAGRSVYPIYVRCGLAWEEEERKSLDGFLREVRNPAIRRVVVLNFPMSDVYGQAWYSSGVGIPGYHEADQRWEIPGRNMILLSKAAVWCALNSIEAIALGILSSNPFPDATPGFFSSMEEALSRGLAHPIRIVRPFDKCHKADVVRLGQTLPLQLTLSCASPVASRHCGRCGKCRERIEAFAEAGVADPTEYA
ncbi:MAG: 7-cyano-7-deazaguanine synthase [Acidobacteria bacterium]|nr:MAG: 7-cyano-7-deazaguanine synthase [Acidobacteriota bacterium]